MAASIVKDYVERRYRESFGATLRADYSNFLGRSAEADCCAALGFRRAGAVPLFLEAYLDAPIEVAASRALGRNVAREAIVEIGNFAADNALVMLGLWTEAANDLGDASEVAVATLTSPLRQVFARIGIPIVEIAPANPARIGAGREWGDYYASAPMVCAGVIAEGQQALARFAARRVRARAA